MFTIASQESKATPLTIEQEGELLMVVAADGTITFPSEDPEGAAKVFCEHFREIWRRTEAFSGCSA